MFWCCVSAIGAKEVYTEVAAATHNSQYSQVSLAVYTATEHEKNPYVLTASAVAKDCHTLYTVVNAPETTMGS